MPATKMPFYILRQSLCFSFLVFATVLSFLAFLPIVEMAIRIRVNFAKRCPPKPGHGAACQSASQESPGRLATK